MAAKPKTLGDIVSSKPGHADWNAFQTVPRRLNLSAARRRFRFPVVRWLTRGITVAAVIFLVLGSASAPTLRPTHAAGDSATSTDPGAERAQLEQQLKDLEAQM